MSSENRGMIENVREQIDKTLNASAEEIYFTSWNRVRQLGDKRNSTNVKRKKDGISSQVKSSIMPY